MNKKLYIINNIETLDEKIFSQIKDGNAEITSTNPAVILYLIKNNIEQIIATDLFNGEEYYAFEEISDTLFKKTKSISRLISAANGLSVDFFEVNAYATFIFFAVLIKYIEILKKIIINKDEVYYDCGIIDNLKYYCGFPDGFNLLAELLKFSDYQNHMSIRIYKIEKKITNENSGVLPLSKKIRSLIFWKTKKKIIICDNNTDIDWANLFYEEINKKKYSLTRTATLSALYKYRDNDNSLNKVKKYFNEFFLNIEINDILKYKGFGIINFLKKFFYDSLIFSYSRLIEYSHFLDRIFKNKELIYVSGNSSSIAENFVKSIIVKKHKGAVYNFQHNGGYAVQKTLASIYIDALTADKCYYYSDVIASYFKKIISADCGKFDSVKLRKYSRVKSKNNESPTILYITRVSINEPYIYPSATIPTESNIMIMLEVLKLFKNNKQFVARLHYNSNYQNLDDSIKAVISPDLMINSKDSMIELMSKYDYLIIDMISTPLFEALSLDKKKIICYTAEDYIKAEDDAINKLSKRVIVARNKEQYFDILRQFSLNADSIFKNVNANDMEFIKDYIGFNTNNE